jgi:hypothetical protein
MVREAGAFAEAMTGRVMAGGMPQDRREADGESEEESVELTELLYK